MVLYFCPWEISTKKGEFSIKSEEIAMETGDIAPETGDITPETDFVIKYVAYITTKDGRRIYASQFGKKAFPIKVKNPA